MHHRGEAAGAAQHAVAARPLAVTPSLAVGPSLFRDLRAGGVGDIVTIRTRDLPQHEDGPNIIKRVIGLPGDTIEIKDGAVYRNGEFLQESYLPDQTVTEVRNPDYAAVALGPDEYFVMGDNRAVSLDSRSIGPIPANHMIGEVLLRFYPWQDFGQP